ncbi:hypothetical protein ACT17_06110 [Mycolicibacterium conceptionense]|uniref:Uncharacterized protein n=1 Tax=Mycolicibacterium conceptionense TaxID=451644 RepID=A0A0J8UFB5_9MYCO|nr:hypothetical protein ACT17_06110 [Mycolicibacterium conceptionense]
MGGTVGTAVARSAAGRAQRSFPRAALLHRVFDLVFLTTPLSTTHLAVPVAPLLDQVQVITVTSAERLVIAEWILFAAVGIICRPLS